MILDTISIDDLFKKTRQIDAIVYVADEVLWDNLNELAMGSEFFSVIGKIKKQLTMIKLERSHLNYEDSTIAYVRATDSELKMATFTIMDGVVHSFEKATIIGTKNEIRLNPFQVGW